MDLSFTNQVLLLGFSNAFVLFVSLLFLPIKNRKPALYLGLFILFYTISIFNWTLLPVLLRKFGYPIDQIPVLHFIPVFAYFFVRSIKDPRFSLDTISKWLLVPGILYVAYKVLSLIYLRVYPQGNLYKAFTGQTQHFIVQGTAIIFSIFCTWLIYTVFKDVKKNDYKQYQYYSYVFYFLLYVLCRWIFTTINDLFSFVNFNENIFFTIEIIFFLIIGYRSLINPKKMLLASRKVNKTSGSAMHDHAQRLKAIMEEEHLFLRKELTRKDLANKLGVSDTEISTIIKNELHTSFYTFVNTYRIQEAVKLLEAGMGEKFTMTAIGEKVGFKSRSTFYKVFGELQHETPNEFKKRVANGLKR